MREEKRYLPLLSLFVSICVFYYFLIIYFMFEKDIYSFQFENYFFFIKNLYSFSNKNILFKNIFCALDSVSLSLILLTTFIFPICFYLITNIYYIKKKRVFLLLLWILEFNLILVFYILDLFIFFILFELTLIPMFILIGKGGTRFRKIKAGYYLFFYTFLGSIFMFIGILFIYSSIGSTNFIDIWNFNLNEPQQTILWFFFFLSFAVKIPIIPFHIWLPEAHVEAPTIGSIILASILLKLGVYGFIRFSIPLFPFGNIFFSPIILTLSLISVLYASMTTIRQIDIKRIIAYSSIAHMNMIILGLFSLNKFGFWGAFYLMLGHGLISGALFFSIGILYEKYHTRLIFYYGGLTSVMPFFSFFFLFFLFANVGFPGTFNFLSELTILISIVFYNYFLTFFISGGIILSIVYNIWLFNRIMFGSLKINYIKSYSDLNKKELYISFLFFILILIFGLNSFFFSQLFNSNLFNVFY